MKGVIKRIAILEIMALLATNLPAVGTFAASNEYDISNGSITITAASGCHTIEQGGGSYQIYNPAVPVITGNSAGGTLTINSENGEEAHVILKDLTIDVSNGVNPAIAANCKAYIELQGDNILKGGRYKAGLEHTGYNEDQVLRIGGTGILYAEGGAGYYNDSYGPAGIGGSVAQNASYIDINGGTITSKGGPGGAGIGGGGGGGKAGTHITINDGNVTATGGSGASGIGGGENGTGSDITINGGNVTAKGGRRGAGIGGGYNDNGKGINIRITGGTVTASGGERGAGIGGGDSADGRNITITGGTVIAAGGAGAAGIGGGTGNDEGQNKFGTGSNIIISGSCDVKVSGGTEDDHFYDYKSGAAIGNGGGNTKDGEEVLPDTAGLQGGSITYYPRGTGISDMEAGTVTPLGTPYTVSFNANSENDSVTVSPEKKIVFSGASEESIYGDLPSPTREGYRFDGWFTERTGGTEIKRETSVSLNNDQYLYAHWTKYEGYTITYNNEDGTVRKTQKYPSRNSGDNILDGAPDGREGYDFDGWKVITASGNWIDGRVYDSRKSLEDMYGDITVSGQWSGVRYKVRFYPNGGSGSMNDQDREYGDRKELPENRFTYDRHKFMGWSNLDNESIIGQLPLNPALIKYYPDRSKDNVYRSSITKLYALWEYTVTFDTDGGTDIADQKYYILSDNTLPAVQKNGSVFKGWKAGEVTGNWIDGRIYDAGTALKGKYGDVRLTAIWEADTETFSKGDSNSVNRITKSVVLSGLDLKTNKDTVITLLGPSKSVSYNGRTHVWAGTSLSRKQQKRKCADLDIATEQLPGTVSSSFRYKGTGKSSDGRACFYIRLRADKSSAYYKSLNRDDKKKLKKAIKKANKILKENANRLYFSIEQMDLGDFIFDKEASHGGHYVFKRKNGNGDTLTAESHRRKHVSQDGKTISYSYDKILVASFSGVRCSIPKREYRRTSSGGTVTITGKNKSITGSMSGSTK